MLLGEVAVLKKGELVMAGIPEGDYKDKVADELLRFYQSINQSIYFVTHKLS